MNILKGAIGVFNKKALQRHNERSKAFHSYVL